jgi:hypothetical protein
MGMSARRCLSLLPHTGKLSEMLALLLLAMQKSGSLMLNAHNICQAAAVGCGAAA